MQASETGRAAPRSASTSARVPRTVPTVHSAVKRAADEHGSTGGDREPGRRSCSSRQRVRRGGLDGRPGVDLHRRWVHPYVEYEFGESSVMGDESSGANRREFRHGGRELWREIGESSVRADESSGGKWRECRHGERALWREFGESGVGSDEYSARGAREFGESAVMSDEYSADEGRGATTPSESQNRVLL